MATQVSDDTFFDSSTQTTACELTVGYLDGLSSADLGNGPNVGGTAVTTWPLRVVLNNPS